MRTIEEIIASRPVARANKKGVVSKAARKLASQQCEWWWQGLTSEERRAVERYDDEQAAIRMAQPEDPRITAARVAQMERSIALGADATKVERMTQEERDLMREDLGDYSHHRVR